MAQLDGRKVVIIGGSYGIGLATAELAVAAGSTRPCRPRKDGFQVIDMSPGLAV